MGFCTHTVSLCVGCRYGLLCVPACTLFVRGCAFFFCCFRVHMDVVVYAYAILFHTHVVLYFRIHAIVYCVYKCAVFPVI